MIMRLIFLIILILASRAFATLNCANFTGHYQDEEKSRIEIKQNACETISFISEEKISELILDGQSRLFEKGKTQNSYVAATINQTELNLEQLIRSNSAVPPEYLYKLVLKYKFKDPNTLIENTELYNQAGVLLDHKTLSLTRSDF